MCFLYYNLSFIFDSLSVEDFCELLSVNEKKKKRHTGFSVRMVESTPDAESMIH